MLLLLNILIKYIYIYIYIYVYIFKYVYIYIYILIQSLYGLYRFRQYKISGKLIQLISRSMDLMEQPTSPPASQSANHPAVSQSVLDHIYIYILLAYQESALLIGSPSTRFEQANQ